MARQTESRVTKRSSSAGPSTRRATRQRSRMLASSLSSATVLEDVLTSATDTLGTDFGCHEMDVEDDTEDEQSGRSILAEGDASLVEESQDYFDALSQPMHKGKGKSKGLAIDETLETELQVFRLMDLPTEIRLEIYRACLTRPCKIFFSKAEPPPPQPQPAIEGQMSDEEAADMAANSQLRNPKLDVQAAPAAYQAFGAGPSRPGRPRAVRMRGSARLGQQMSGESHVNRAVGRPGVARSPLLDFPATSTPLPSQISAYIGLQDTDQSGSTQTATPSTPKPRQNYASPEDPLIINILRTSKQVYKEARAVLYSENVFDISVKTAVPSLAALHQRSRRHIKHIELEIPTYTEILEGFSEIVRLSLRYCSGLRKFVIHTPFQLPGADGNSASNTAVYANGFDILRWLPQQCLVVLTGTKNPEIDMVVSKHLTLAKSQNEDMWAQTQFVQLEHVRLREI